MFHTQALIHQVNKCAFDVKFLKGCSASVIVAQAFFFTFILRKINVVGGVEWQSVGG